MKKFFKWCLIIFVAFVIIGIFASGDDSDKASTQKEVYVTTAVQLFKDYEANEVAADEKMKDKLVEVSGSVASIDKDISDSAIVVLRTTNEFMGARMSMKKSEKDKAMELKRGDKVTIVCERMSRLIGSPSGRSCYFK